MAALDLATKDDLVAVLEELRAVRREVEGLRADRAEETITLDEAAQLLRVSRRTVQRWVRDGLLPATSVGRVRRVKRADLAHLAG